MPECDVDEMEEFLDNLLFMTNQLQLFNMSEIDEYNAVPEMLKLITEIIELMLTKERVNSQGSLLKAQMKPL